MNVYFRFKIEELITRRVIVELINHFGSVVIDDDDHGTGPVSDVDEALNVAMSLDCVLFKTTGGVVMMVYGNDGFDAIADYSTSLEHIIGPITEWAETEFDNSDVFSFDERWKPIATAPRDGTWVITCIPGFRPAVAQYSNEKWLIDCDDNDPVYYPEYWMPIINTGCRI